eukprot:COSAG02_NODE_2064_length_9963_cov_5.638179_2_plen_58_part_00
MADAIDDADLFLYGVSEDYKISQNCRLEAVRPLSWYFRYPWFRRYNMLIDVGIWCGV